MYDDLTQEVEQFLYSEARLLDERRFHEWLELFADGARYWMGGRSNRYPKTSKAIAILDPDRYVEDDLAREGDLAILDETKETLARRVARLETGMAWAEDPRRARATWSPIARWRRAMRCRSSQSTATSSSTAAGRNRAGFLCRFTTRCAAASRRRVEDRLPQATLDRTYCPPRT